MAHQAFRLEGVGSLSLQGPAAIVAARQTSLHGQISIFTAQLLLWSDPLLLLVIRRSQNLRICTSGAPARIILWISQPAGVGLAGKHFADPSCDSGSLRRCVRLGLFAGLRAPFQLLGHLLTLLAPGFFALLRFSSSSCSAPSSSMYAISAASPCGAAARDRVINRRCGSPYGARPRLNSRSTDSGVIR